MDEKEKNKAYAAILRGDSALTPGFLQRLASSFSCALTDVDEGSGPWESIRALSVDISEVIRKESGKEEADQFLEDCGCYDLTDDNAK